MTHRDPRGRFCKRPPPPPILPGERMRALAAIARGSDPATLDFLLMTAIAFAGAFIIAVLI
jgi:hypothetical protein